jgi:hippurate hydrolase
MIDDGLLRRFPAEAVIKLNLCAFDEGVRESVLAAIERIVNADSPASGAPKQPEIATLHRYLLIRNDSEATGRVGAMSRLNLTADRLCRADPMAECENFGLFGAERGAPSVFWLAGGIDSGVYAKAEKEGRIGEIPKNHDPRFAPVIHRALETGVETLVGGAQAWLSA